jgi:hypothetical protein
VGGTKRNFNRVIFQFIPQLLSSYLKALPFGEGVIISFDRQDPPCDLGLGLDDYSYV